MKSRIIAFFLLCTCGAPALAQEEFIKVELRVISSKPVVVDRGSGDGLAIGDVVRFFSRQGNTYRGDVTDLDERSAVVRVVDPSYVPEPGTRAETRIPRERLGEEPEPEEQEAPVVPPVLDPDPDEPDELPEAGDPAVDEPAEREAPEYENQDEDWRPGMTLLAEVEPVDPANRPSLVTGRYYVRGHSSFFTEDDRSNSLYRTGIDVRYENPWGHGGTLRFASDLSYRDANAPDRGDYDDWKFRVDRLSYAQGGTRFNSTRWEMGRFLQRGMPEFGYIDGVEWGRRRENGDRYGASLGGMPERDYKFEEDGDFQLAGYYEWVRGEREQLTFAAGFQKTIHKGDSDRDLLVTRFRYLPYNAWNYNATLWVDFYSDSDNANDGNVKLTQAVASANRRWSDKSGVDLSYYHITFPDIDRDGEFVSPIPRDEIADNRTDRLELSAYIWAVEDLKLFGRVGGWDDEDDHGGNGELGFTVRDVWGPRTEASVACFGTSGQFEDDLGARVSLAQTLKSGRWDLFYEFANHRQEGFSSDFNDVGQHRVRASRDWYTASGWTVSVYGEGAYWDEDGAFSAGFYLQKIF